MNLDNVNWTLTGMSIFIVLLSISFHEFAHAKFADAAGDPTPRNQGRVTLNPLAHLDPIGTIFIVISSIAGYGIGWGKPVMVDPSKMRNPRWDHFASVLAGPMMNLLQAAIYAIGFRIIMHWPAMAVNNFNLVLFVQLGVIINLSLFFFNLIPIGPLDGHWLVGTFMPEKTRFQWYRFNRGFGSMIFLLLVLLPRGGPFDPFERVLYPLVSGAASFFTGVQVGK